MAQEYANLCQALASVLASASGAGVVPSYAGSSPGFNPTGVGAAHTAVGVYDLVLDDALGATTQACMIATARSASADTNISVSHVSDTVKRVTTSIAGAASDAVSFDVMAFRRPG